MQRTSFAKDECPVARSVNSNGRCEGRTVTVLASQPGLSNYFTGREALIQAGRADPIGGCEGLIPARPPKEAIEARRRQANRAVHGDEDHDHYPTVANPANGEQPGERGAGTPKPTGSRPGRKSQQRRQGNKK